jgi:hypothetical protein
MELLFRPLPLCATALLALNDHLLKAWLHNPVTGKLSDVAGCFVLPLFIAAVLELVGVRSPRARLNGAFVVTVVFFTALKSSPPVAGLVSHLLATAWAQVGVRTGGIVADPTDLLALPAAAAAWAWGRAQGGALQRVDSVGGASCA